MPQSLLTAWLRKATPVIRPAHEDGDRQGEDDLRTASAAPSATPHNQTGSKVDDGDEEFCDQERAAFNAITTRGLASLKSSLPDNVEIRNCTEADIPAFKQINSLLLPVPYPDSFYRAIYEDAVTANLTIVAVWHDDLLAKDNPKHSGRVIGGIRCRLFGQPVGSATPSSKSGTAMVEREKPMLYLSTLVLLSPYRSHGIAASMLRTITARAIEAYGIGSVGAHVWETNVEGLEWYRKRGFREIGKEEEYYRKLRPSGAFVMRREVSVMDLLPSCEQSDRSN